MSTLFERLKSNAQQQPREIEALIDPMKHFGSLDAYKAHVLKSWAFYLPLEGDLAQLDWRATGINFAARRKMPPLEEDLGILGVTRPEPQESTHTLDRANLPFALGRLYVLEGATLGGHLISRYLSTIGIGPAKGELFFNGYGARTGEMWKSFQASATGYCVTEVQIGEAVSGAKATFKNFGRSMHG